MSHLSVIIIIIIIIVLFCFHWLKYVSDKTSSSNHLDGPLYLTAGWRHEFCGLEIRQVQILVLFATDNIMLLNIYVRQFE